MKYVRAKKKLAEPVKVGAPAKGKELLEKPVTKRTVARRWTEELVGPGWTPIANPFLELYSSLTPPITSPEAMFIVHLMLFKWDERHPYPAFKKVAARMGMSAAAARGHARSLQRKGYLHRIFRKGERNQFDFTPLFQQLELALAERTARDEANRKPSRGKTDTHAELQLF